LTVFFFGTQSSLTLTAVGLATGLCVHIGHESTYIVPVYKTSEQFHALCILPVGGKHVLKLMSDLIKQKYKAELDPLVIAKLREACYFKGPKVTIEEAEQEAEATKIDYKTEQGLVLQGLGRERVLSPEVLFDPTLIELDDWGIHEFINSSISKCDGHLVPDLWKHIVLSGFCSSITGFENRLQKELQALAPNDLKVEICKTANDPGFLPFLGAKKMIEFDGFKDYSLQRSEYLIDSPLAILSPRTGLV